MTGNKNQHDHNVATFNPLKSSGYHVYHLVELPLTLRCTHEVNLWLLYRCQKRKPSLLCTSLSDWS